MFCFSELDLSKLVFRSIVVVFKSKSRRDHEQVVLFDVNTLKCPKIVKNYYYGAPPPPELDLSKLTVFKSKSRRNHEQVVLFDVNTLKCPKIVKNYYGAPPPPELDLSKLVKTCQNSSKTRQNLIKNLSKMFFNRSLWFSSQKVVVIMNKKWFYSTLIL